MNQNLNFVLFFFFATKASLTHLNLVHVNVRQKLS